MRCLVLADYLAQQGAQCVFATIEDTNKVVPALADKGYRTILPENITNKNPDFIIIDHYSLEEYFYHQLKNINVPSMIIDDLCDRDFYPCDILLINNLAYDAKNYEGLVPSDCEILADSEFMLVRPEFLDFDVKNNSLKTPPENLFIFFGGTDPAHLTRRILNIMKEHNIDVPHIDVVIGKGNADRQEIEALCQDMNASLYVQIDNMAEIMKNADLAIGCGGTAIWERLSLGIPTLEISHSDWQIPTLQTLDRQQYLKYLGKSVELNDSAIAAQLTKTLENGLDLRYCPCGQGVKALAQRIIEWG